MSYRRGKAAYAGLTRTDPEAVWSYQGWAFISWKNSSQEAMLKGYVDSAPKGYFSVIDMSEHGSGEWHMWNDAAFFGTPFIFTSLNNFGGTDGIRGNFSRANTIPYDAIDAGANVWGSGFTPEGIDQNTVYYEMLISAPWRSTPISNISAWASNRAFRRYGGDSPNVARSWSLLSNSSYNQDLSVQDRTGVTHMPGSNS